MVKPKKDKAIHDLFGGKPQIAPGVLPGIKIDNLKPMICKCSNALFLQASNVHFASPLQAVSGGPTMVQVPLGFYCTACEKINDFDLTDIPTFAPPAPTPETKH